LSANFTASTNPVHPELISYKSPLVIYNYLKSDINNLIKDDKASTSFSTTNLKARWKNHTYFLKTSYQGSSNSKTFALLSVNSTKNLNHLY
jgi:hypothetical protein